MADLNSKTTFDLAEIELLAEINDWKMNTCGIPPENKTQLWIKESQCRRSQLPTKLVFLNQIIGILKRGMTRLCQSFFFYRKFSILCCLLLSLGCGWIWSGAALAASIWAAPECWKIWNERHQIHLWRLRRGGGSGLSPQTFPTSSAWIQSWCLSEENGKIKTSTGRLECVASFSRTGKPLVLMEFDVCSAHLEFWVVTILNAELKTQISAPCMKIYVFSRILASFPL